MIDTSLQPVSGLGRGHFSRQRRVREAIGEARAALQVTVGVPTPAPRPLLDRARRWGRALVQKVTRRTGRRRPARRPVAVLGGRHWPTLVVLGLLGLAVASQALGVNVVYSVAAADGGSNRPLLNRGPESGPLPEAFAFAVGPMTMVQRQPAASTPPTEYSVDGPQASAPRTTVVTYTVAAGDTLDGIAENFGIAAYTIFWSNGLRSPTDLQPGMVLLIPPISGVPHTVSEGETLESVADMYGVRAGNIVGYPPNGLKYPYTLQAGQEIFIPGGIVEIPARRVSDGYRPPPTLVQMPGGEKLSWPTWGEITAPFGWSRAHGAYHNGIDIANDWGTPIYAAAAGEVVVAGWGGLGWYVVIDHGNGFRTEYGHMASKPLVVEGEHVERGERIGLMGRTYGSGGYATGVHLHFSVRHRGVYIDPLPLLKN